MYYKIQLFLCVIFCLFLTSCEPELLPDTEPTVIDSSIKINADSGNEEAPIDEKEG